MGRLPILEVDGQQVAQSKSIERFVARRYGFLGENDVEAAQIDCVCEHVRDIKDAYQKVRGIQDEAEKKAGMEKWFATDLPEWCGKFEKVYATHASRTLLLTAGMRANALTPACAQLTPVALTNGRLFSRNPPLPGAEDDLDSPGRGGRKQGVDGRHHNLLLAEVLL